MLHVYRESDGLPNLVILLFSVDAAHQTGVDVAAALEGALAGDVAVVGGTQAVPWGAARLTSQRHVRPTGQRSRRRYHTLKSRSKKKFQLCLRWILIPWSISIRGDKVVL